MKSFISVLLLTISFGSFAQLPEENINVNSSDSGIHEFTWQGKQEKPDYSKPYHILMKEVNEDPGNAELHYFLGYTIDRMNANDGSNIPQLTKEMTLRASEQFEEVNRLQPFYKGEMLLLDPYSKLTAIWGCLAQAYLLKNENDSAMWAFSEGKRRGGFIEPVLSFNRQLLSDCLPNAILVTYGDIITIPLWYLQHIENFRTDVTVVDANLIYSDWYVEYLNHIQKLKFGYDNAALDTLKEIAWTSTEMHITNPKNENEILSWTLKPASYDGFLLRGDRILLDILEQNFFQRPFYFNGSSDSTYNLSLDDHLEDEGILERVVIRPNNEKKLSNLEHYTIDSLKPNDILKSNDAIRQLSAYRFSYYSEIVKLMNEQKLKPAKELLAEVENKFVLKKLPFTSDAEKEFYDQLKNYLESND